VRIRTAGGRLQIDVDTPDEKIHVLCPLSTIDDVAVRIEEKVEKASSGPAA